MKKLFFPLIAFSLLFSITFAQNPPCAPDMEAYTFSVEELSSYPPYSTSMPYEVLIGYIALDTITYYGCPPAVEEFISRQTYNDTLRTIMKHYYWVIDYDPVKYFQTETFFDTSMTMNASQLARYIRNAIEKVSPEPMLDLALCRSDIIAHVYINDTVKLIDTTTLGPSKLLYNVTCEIKDTIKGKRIPPCNLAPQNKIDKSLTSVPALPNSCLQFAYSPYWSRKIASSRKNLFDKNGAPWIKKDSEYIIFLNIVSICKDSTTRYYGIRPIGPESGTFLMYPVIDGEVYDPGDDFGFGTGLTPSEFKAALRARINTIKYFTID